MDERADTHRHFVPPAPLQLLSGPVLVLETFEVKSEASQLKGHGAMKKLMLQRSEKTNRPQFTESTIDNSACNRAAAWRLARTSTKNRTVPLPSADEALMITGMPTAQSGRTSKRSRGGLTQSTVMGDGAASVQLSGT